MDRRQFIQGGAALLASAALFRPGLAGAAAPLGLAAVRVGPDRIRVTWTNKAVALTIRAGARPDAPPAEQTLVAREARGGSVEIKAPTRPRPYLLVTASDGTTHHLAERLLPLAGGRNFRDLGGYAASNGGTVAWGRLYRSGVMADLTDPDVAYLSGLGIRIVCDLRSEGERSAFPTRLPAADDRAVRTFDYEMGGMMRRLFTAKTREEAIDIFAAAYWEMTDFLAPNFRAMFDDLLEGRAPLAVNCTAGKDRTGVAAALILSALGVAREDVIADYALSEAYVPASFYLNQIRDPAPGANTGMSERERAFMSQLPDPVLTVILGSEPEVMRRALARMDAEFGGPTGLVMAKYGVSGEGIARLRARYLV